MSSAVNTIIFIQPTRIFRHHNFFVEIPTVPCPLMEFPSLDAQSRSWCKAEESCSPNWGLNSQHSLSGLIQAKSTITMIITQNSIGWLRDKV